MRILCAQFILTLTLLASGLNSFGADSQVLPGIAVSKSGRTFVEVGTGKPFTPWGFNYDHDRKKRLLEDYWDAEWPTVVEDFREMKELGANVVRIHLQFGKFMTAPDQPDKSSLKQLERLLKLAEETGIYLDLTGLACYRKADEPRWYADLDETARWRAQANFWAAIAGRCRSSPAVFCYDLMNEPFAPSEPRKPGDWLAGEFDGFSFVQAITLNPAKRKSEEIFAAWTTQLVRAIRQHDSKHLITVGMLPIATPGWVRTVGKNLDFISVHEYPHGGKIKESLDRLKIFRVGKPLVIEETFPLTCSSADLRQFIKQSAPIADGWIGFYWGQTPAELKQATGIGEAITRDWLELFQAINPNKSR